MTRARAVSSDPRLNTITAISIMAVAVVLGTRHIYKHVVLVVIIVIVMACSHYHTRNDYGFGNWKCLRRSIEAGFCI